MSAEYETHELIEVNRQRVASDPRVQASMHTWRSMFPGSVEIDVYQEIEYLRSSLPGIARRKTRVNALMPRQSIYLRKNFLRRRWMRGSSPRMTG